MLTSIATIAGMVTAVLAAIGAVVVAVKKKQEASKIGTIEQINATLKQHLSDEDRQKVQDALNDIINSK
jgi:cell division protein FtsX